MLRWENCLIKQKKTFFLKKVTTEWGWSNLACDLWVAADVMASTASILNLVAIAVDR